MAKWGEGDPRWIVEERPDATNVNNWHWTEKNATTWSKERFNQLFTNLNISNENTVCTVETVSKCVGEATVNNRKGRLIFFYEWDLTMDWTGRLMSSNKKHKGKISIPNLSEEHDLKDVEITITIEVSTEESETVKQFMYNIGRSKIREQLESYVKELKEEYSKNLILPSKTSETQSQQCPKNNLRNEQRSLQSPVNAETKKNVLGCKQDVRTLSFAVEFQCTSSDLYNALTKVEMVTAFTRCTAKVDATRGGEFQMYDDNVHGVFDELQLGKKLCMRWRLKSWSSGHYSNVVLDFVDTKNGTLLKLVQTGIPAAEYATMKSNWYRYYWNSIKQTFGFGIPLTNAL